MVRIRGQKRAPHHEHPRPHQARRLPHAPRRRVRLLPRAPLDGGPRLAPAAQHDGAGGDAPLPREHRAEGAARCARGRAGAAHQAHADADGHARHASVRVLPHAGRRAVPELLPLGVATHHQAPGDAVPLPSPTPQHRRAPAARGEGRRADRHAQAREPDMRAAPHPGGAAAHGDPREPADHRAHPRRTGSPLARGGRSTSSA